MPQRQISKGVWIQAIGLLTVLFLAGLFLFHSFNLYDWAKGLPFWPRVVMMILIGANVFLPLPSSAVMTTNGTLFGPRLAFCVSFCGSMLAWTIWYWLGRLFGWTGRPTAASQRSQTDVNDISKDPVNGQGDRISLSVQRYGVGALIMTRPVPVLAEFTAGACGIARMNFWRFLAGAALGVAPMAALYTWMGNQYGDTWAAPIVAMLVPCSLYLLIARPWKHRPATKA